MSGTGWRYTAQVVPWHVGSSAQHCDTLADARVWAAGQTLPVNVCRNSDGALALEIKPK